MPWPEIFFKARKPRTAPAKTASEKPDSEEKKSPTPDPKPVDFKKLVNEEPKPPAAPPAIPPPLPPSESVVPTGGATQTIPVVHGVVLRPPARVVLGPPAQPITPMKNIEQLMAEADPVKTLRQTGSIHLLKRLTPDPAAPPVSVKATGPVPAKAPPLIPPPVPPAVESPWPQYSAKAPAPTRAPIEASKPEPVQISTPTPEPVLTEVKEPEDDDSPFILKPKTSMESPPPVVAPFLEPPAFEPTSVGKRPEDEPPAVAKPPPFVPPITEAPAVAEQPATETPAVELAAPAQGGIFRRKAKLADVARIVLPPKREESTRLPFPPHPELAPAVVPPAFPVSSMTQRPGKITVEKPESAAMSSDAAKESPFLERREAKKEMPKPSEPVPAPFTPIVEQKSPEPLSLFPDPPKVDPEAHKPEKADTSLPKVDPEAHRPPPSPAPAEAAKVLSTTPEPRLEEKREFHLTNGEHVAGVVLSETPEAIYVEHEALGVITVPRKEIAKRLVEIILTNGDRIVGDIMAETADTIYVRHASLGMLTVPRSHRSQRVVEAILKDGDRILGEVLTETETFTVIRSATLGTITVPHTKLAMLNRKLEQIDMKTLPAPELKDETSS